MKLLAQPNSLCPLITVQTAHSFFTSTNNKGIFSLAIVSQIGTIAIFFRDLKKIITMTSKNPNMKIYRDIPSLCNVEWLTH